MNKKKSDKRILIVGQGIAGSILAWCLHKSGHNILIVDDHHRESSSMVSAGIRNPITGQRLAVTPHFDLYSQYAKKIYTQISLELGSDCFVEKQVIRVLRNKDEFQRCQYLETLVEVESYIKAINPPGFYGKILKDPFGTMLIGSSGYFQTQILLETLRKYFLNKNMLIEERFFYDDLKIGHHDFVWKSQKLDTVIFCEGFQTKQNPWFKDLSYNFVKGELLKVTFDDALLPDAIICQQQWCLPLNDGTYLAGATYDRDHIDTIPTSSGATMIINGLNQFIDSKIKVVEHVAGVRPVMLNQKPVAHMHSSIPCLGIFNGFGSKGFLWVPYFAQRFVENFI